MGATRVKDYVALLARNTAGDDFPCSSDIVKLLTDIYTEHTNAGEDERQREEIVCALDSEGGADTIVRIISSLSQGEATATVRECIYRCYCILWDFSDTSGDFIQHLLDTDIVNICVGNLKNRKAVIAKENGRVIIKASLGVLYNVSRVDDARERMGSHDWTCLNQYKEGKDEFSKALSAMILAFLSDEETTKKMGEKEITIYIVTLLREAETDPNHRKQGLTCTELIEGLARLALNDDNKRTAQESDTVSLLIAFLKTGDESEQVAASKCLWTLAFNDSVKKELEMYRGVLDNIRSSASSDSNEQLVENMRGLMLTLQSEVPSGGDEGHIMVSYSWSGDYNQETARKIASYLKECGYEVWIDVQNLRGSLNDAMVNALNNAKIFILCVSEGYRRSNNCRLEATYAHQFRKIVIPVIVEPRSSSKGDWLTLLLRDIKYVEFTRGTHFDEKCEELRREVHFYMQGTTSDEVDAGPRLQGPSDVTKWVEDNQLESFTDIFRGIDASHFPALQNLRRNAPEFFYRSLWEADDDQKKRRFMDIVKLNKALEEL